MAGERPGEVAPSELGPIPGLVPYCESGALVAQSGIVDPVLGSEERGGGEANLVAVPCSSWPRDPHGESKVVHAPSCQVAIACCCPSRRRMSSAYAMPILMAYVIGSMVGPMRMMDASCLSSTKNVQSFAVSDDLRIALGMVESTLDMDGEVDSRGEIAGEAGWHSLNPFYLSTVARMAVCFR